MSKLLDKMQRATKEPVVILHRITTLRSKYPEINIFVFEGNDDVLYYDVVLNIIDSSKEYAPICGKGKDQLLGARDLCHDNDSKKIYFFIDKDFDGFKKYKKTDNVYCTENYSIENNIVSIDAFKSLLNNEFGLVKTEEDFSDFSEMLKNIINDFNEKMKEPNLAIFYLRKKDIKSGSIENNILKYINITLDGISITDNDIYDLVSFPNDIDRKEIYTLIDDFEKLDPIKEWRGKFIFGFFKEVLKLLKRDRTSNDPKFFREKYGMNFNVDCNLIRILSSISKPHESLVKFISSVQ